MGNLKSLKADIIDQKASNSSSLQPVQVLYVKMIVLAIQDLHLEEEFIDLKEWFIVTKARDAHRRNVVSALSWLFSSDTTYCLSFVNCCSMLLIDPSRLRDTIFRLASQSSNPVVLESYNDFFMVECK